MYTLTLLLHLGQYCGSFWSKGSRRFMDQIWWAWECFLKIKLLILKSKMGRKTFQINKIHIFFSYNSGQFVLLNCQLNLQTAANVYLQSKWVKIGQEVWTFVCFTLRFVESSMQTKLTGLEVSQKLCTFEHPALFRVLYHPGWNKILW